MTGTVTITAKSQIDALPDSKEVVVEAVAGNGRRHREDLGAVPDRSVRKLDRGDDVRADLLLPARRLRPSDLRSLLVGHHGAAQGDRPQPRRPADRAPA